MSLLELRGVVTVGGVGPLDVSVGAGGEASMPEAVVPVALGIESPARGGVSLFGEPLDALDAQARRQLRTKVAWIGREPRLLAHLDVRENVALPLRFHRRVREHAVDRVVGQALSDWGLASLAAARPHTLTANQRRSVARVRALLCEPAMLLVVDDHTELDRRLCDDVRARGGAVVHLRPGTA